APVTEHVVVPVPFFISSALLEFCAISVPATVVFASVVVPVAASAPLTCNFVPPTKVSVPDVNALSVFELRNCVASKPSSVSASSPLPNPAPEMPVVGSTSAATPPASSVPPALTSTPFAAKFAASSSTSCPAIFTDCASTSPLKTVSPLGAPVSSTPGVI